MITIKQHVTDLRDALMEAFPNAFKDAFVGERVVDAIVDVKTRSQINFDDTKGAYFYLILPDFLAYNNAERENSCSDPNFVFYTCRLVLFVPKKDTWELELVLRQWFSHHAPDFTLKSVDLNRWDVFERETGKDVKSKKIDHVALLSFELQAEFRISIPADCNLNLSYLCP